MVTGPQGIGSDPSRAEFIYGEWLRDDFLRDTLPMPHSSVDTILLLAQARETAVSLHGARASAHLPVIPTAAIRTALSDAASDVMVALQGDERNVLLTPARMWWTAANRSFVSKDEVAAWATMQVPAEAQDVLELARLAYLGQSREDWNKRQHAERRKPYWTGFRVVSGHFRP